MAVDAGVLDSSYGRSLLVGLLLAWLGDLLLTFVSRRAFRGGLAAFLLGHIACTAAFGVRGTDWLTAAITAAAVLFLT